MTKRTNRVAWGLAVVLGVALVMLMGLFVTRRWPYWVARYRGHGAHLQGVNLARTNMRGVWLEDANLEGANLTDTDLANAIMPGVALNGAKLSGAILTHANLRGAWLAWAN